VSHPRPLTVYLQSELLARARDLIDVGVDNYGWRRDDALVAVSQLVAAGIVISGGDVWRNDGLKPTPAYENWYCEFHPAVIGSADVDRCGTRAREVISGYPADAPVLFEIVCHTA
jgi:hypothetical protein